MTTDAPSKSFAAFAAAAAHRTVIDHRLTSKQRDDVQATLDRFVSELGSLRKDIQASAITDMGAILTTIRDVEQVAAWFDKMGARAANETRTAFYAAALRLRQITEV